jgi:hypothetical protein
MIIALLFAYGEKSVELAYKKTQAQQLLTTINNKFDQEMSEIVIELDTYRKYYRILVNELQKKLPNKGVDKVLDPQPETDAKHKDLQAQSSGLLQFAISKIPGGATNTTQWSYSTLFDVYQTPVIPNDFKLTKGTADNKLLSHINFFGPGLQFIPGDKYAQWYDPTVQSKRDTKILNTLLLDKSGSDNMPMFFFIESNKKPTSYQLAHRQYFRNVRDKKGWNSQFGELSEPRDENSAINLNNKICPNPTKNFYIQRLLNFNNGTRGNTIAMPLYDADNKPITEAGEGFVMVADIDLPALTMTDLDDSKKLLDMTFMVVDRDSGQVLFHLNEDRTLVENLFSFGQGTEKISHRIRAGLGANAQWVEGFYHGIAGAFSYQNMPIEQWALVIFMPNESLDIFMTNLFLLNSIN